MFNFKKYQEIQDFIRKQEYEVIIIDDCSKDYTQMVLKNFKFENFRFFSFFDSKIYYDAW